MLLACLDSLELHFWVISMMVAYAIFPFCRFFLFEIFGFQPMGLSSFLLYYFHVSRYNWTLNQHSHNLPASAFEEPL